MWTSWGLNTKTPACMHIMSVAAYCIWRQYVASSAVSAHSTPQALQHWSAFSSCLAPDCAPWQHCRTCPSAETCRCQHCRIGINLPPKLLLGHDTRWDELSHNCTTCVRWHCLADHRMLGHQQKLEYASLPRCFWVQTLPLWLLTT